jgi:hypothetical protein
MEEKKQLKNFKCQNPDCGHEFMADEFEALECPSCHSEEIAPVGQSWTKYAGVAIVIIGLILYISYLKGCISSHQITFNYDTINCELTAYVDDLEDQPYYYVLGNNQVIQFKECTFKIKSVGNHTIHIFSEGNFEPNSQQKPIASATYYVPKSCEGNQDQVSSAGGPTPQPDLQIIGITLGKGGHGLRIDFERGTCSELEFSISGLNGKFQKSPEFPDAICKTYKKGELVIRCKDPNNGQTVINNGDKKLIGCKPPNPCQTNKPQEGLNPQLKSFFIGLNLGTIKSREVYKYNPGVQADLVEVFHGNSPTPETLAFSLYLVRLTNGNTIAIQKVTSEFECGIDYTGKNAAWLPKKIKVYEVN